MWDVIKALRSHDDDLGEQLDELRRQLGRRGRQPRLPGKIHFDLPARVGVDFARAFDVRLVEQTTASWEFWFGLLERFVELNGDARVPHAYTVDGYRLGLWVITQRHRRSRLDADHQRQLQELPGWTWDPYADQWEGGFNRLLQYVERHGDARVPRSYTVDGYRLGTWITVQRRDYSNGTLDADRRRRLQNLPGWAWDAHADRWEEGFRRLLNYVERHGDARVPVSYTLDGYRLGPWIVKQCSNYAEGTLDADRQRRLQELPGWTWHRHAEKWEDGFRRLSQYVDRHGHARVPFVFTVDGYKLGWWVNVQRNNYAEGTLDTDRQRRLQELPGWTWDARADQWEEGFGRLQAYVDGHSDARVPQSYTVDGYKLGQWVTVQRQRHIEGNLDADRQRRLQELTGWTWDARASCGRRVFGDCWTTSKPTVMPAS